MYQNEAYYHCLFIFKTGLVITFSESLDTYTSIYDTVAQVIGTDTQRQKEVVTGMRYG